MKLHAAVTLTALTGLLVAAPPAAAQTRDPAIATELFNAGRDLMKKGDFASACPKLAKSLDLDPKVGTMARLAECEEKIGHLVNARAHWSQAVNLARTERDDRLALVQTSFKRLDAIVPKVDVELGGNQATSASLHIDGIDLGAASFGVPVPVEPGPHTVVVTATAKQDFTRQVEAKGDGGVVRIEVPLLADAPVVAVVAQAAPPRAQHEAESTGMRPMRIAAFATGGGAVVAAGVGIAFGLIAKGKLDDSNKDGCSGNSCTQPGYGERNDARTAGDVSSVFFITGGALAAAAITLGVLSTRTDPPVTVGVAPGWLTLRGSF